MNDAKVDRSARLRRVLAVLEDGRGHSTLEIATAARVCAVNSCIAELRANGYEIGCRREGDVWRYRLGEAA